MLGDFYSDFEKAAQTYGSSSSSIESKEAAAMLLESGQKLRDSIQDDYALTDAEKAPALAELDELLSSLSAYSSSNARVAVDSFNFHWGRDLVTSIYDKYLGPYFTKISQALSSSPVDGGFIPKSLYENDGTLAFYSGLLDGGYIALKETGTSVWQLAKVVSCLNATAFIREDCRKMVTDSWEAVQGMVGLFNKDAFEKVWGGVVEQVGKFVENNVGMAPMNRYYNGRTAFEIASMFIGAGTITVGLKAMKAAKLAEVVKKVADISDRLDVTSKIMSKAGVVFKKGVGKAGKFVIRDAAGGIVGEAMEYVNGVYKKVKKKTTAHNQYLGTIEGDIEFADGTKGKGSYELWGICGSVSNLRLNANPPKDKNCNVSDVSAKALEFSEKLWKEIASKVDSKIMTKLNRIRKLDPNMKIGYRGSLANGKKHSGADFNPDDFDVDAFIVSNTLANKFPSGIFFRSGERIGELRDIQKELKEDFIKSFKGYRNDKPFTFRIWTEAEYNTKVKPYGDKLF